MPFAGGPSRPPTLLESVVPFLHAQFHPPGAAIAQIVTLPGQVVISFLVVLLGATMPAVLVEVGFIDHPIEGKQLADPAVQGKIADALAEAIEDQLAE